VHQFIGALAAKKRMPMLDGCFDTPIQARGLFEKKPRVNNKTVSAFGKVGLGKMSVGEYQATLNGLNMFFGAVMGFVLTGTEALSSFQFGVILMMLAGVVISIPYIASSRHRVAYSIYALVAALAFPELVEVTLRTEARVPHKIRPTLLVWTVMTIFVEFWGRESHQSPDA
jgi:hypothetical protein